MDAARFERLLDDFFSGDAAPEHIAELERVLRADRDKAKAFAKRSLLDAQLYKAFSGLATPTSVAASGAAVREAVRGVGDRSRFARRAAWATAAAVLVAVGILAFRSIGSRNQPSSPVAMPSQPREAPPPAPPKSEPSLVKPLPQPPQPALHVESGRVRIGGVEVADVPKGERFEVGDRPAVVRFLDGTIAEFDPSTKAACSDDGGESRIVVALREGGGKFAVAKDSRRFRVETPAGIVTVLGTEFTLKLSNASEGEPTMKDKIATALTVVVLSGMVQVELGGQTQIVAAGESRVFSQPTSAAIVQKDADAKKEDGKSIAEAKKDEAKKIADAKKEEAGKGSRDVKGVLKSVDPAKSQITLFRKAKGEDGVQTFDLIKDVLVVIDSKVVKLTDLVPDMALQLRLSEDRKRVIEIREGKAEKKDLDKKVWDVGPKDVKGIVTALDPAKNSITVFAKVMGKDGQRTYQLAKDVPVFLKGQAAKLGDLKLDSSVRLKLSDDRRTVVEIRDGNAKE